MTPNNPDPNNSEQEVAIEQATRYAAIDKIARDELGLETLSTRNSDHQDIYEMGVWQVRKALILAYEAGIKNSSPLSWHATTWIPF